MFEKLKKLLGFGNDVAAQVRGIICGQLDEQVLFDPENKDCLKAYVEYGHKLSQDGLSVFFKVADSSLIKTYLEMGFEIGDKAKQVLLDRNEPELIQQMIDSGSWSPLPFGSCMHHPIGNHHMKEHSDGEEYSGAAAFCH